MSRVLGVTFIVTTGCASLFGLDDPAPATPPPSCVIGSFDLCATQEANGPINFISDTSINTGFDCSLVLFDPEGGSTCVMYATDIVVTGKVTGRGSRPLMLVATGTITVDGTVDVSGNVDGNDGAGANPPACTFEREVVVAANGGGGAGGSFITAGGDGGTGTGSVGLPGLAGDAVSPPILARGGCRGAGVFNSIGGGGGGSVWLVAGASIDVSSTGNVLAGGGGGGGSDPRDIGIGGLGGGGGGSGGFIRLGAPTIHVAGTVIANGGGGGEGSDEMGMAPTSNGADGSATSAGGQGVSARGGDGGGGATNGTASGAAGTNAGVPAPPGAGGGGGGGGAGLIVIEGDTVDTTGATISPQ